jgi:cold shock CspA family protein
VTGKTSKGAIWKGSVKFYELERGRGEIEAENGELLPVHRSALLDDALSGLYTGDIVEFKAGRDRFGRRSALEVRRIGWEEGDDEDAPPREWTF